MKYQLCFILYRFSKLRCICIIYKTILFSLLVKIHLLISKLIYSDSNRQERFLEMSEIICSVENLFPIHFTAQLDYPWLKNLFREKNSSLEGTTFLFDQRARTGNLVSYCSKRPIILIPFNSVFQA